MGGVQSYRLWLTSAGKGLALSEIVSLLTIFRIS